MIKRISIENFKSIEKIVFNVNEENDNLICIIGKNGSGKSNIFKAISYFFDHINSKHSIEHVIDNNNPYIQKCKISIVFDIQLLYTKSRHNESLKGKFERINTYIIDHGSIGSEIELTMTQFRNGEIKWNIEDADICNALKIAFPVYYIDTRRLDLHRWDRLWRIISDLSATSTEKNKSECQKILDETFEKIYGRKYVSSKEIIEKSFNQYSIELDPYNFEDKYKNAFSMRFGGDHFIYDGHSLDYYSDGTSSFNYLRLLISLIPQISDISCKIPLILIDEPELGLHGALISDLVNCISDHLHKNQFCMISTHSPKLIADLCSNCIKYSLYKIGRKGLYSELKKMNHSMLNTKAHIVTTRETECYFCDSLVYVEGETELQLFRNKRLLELFRRLEKLHIYSFDSNDQRLKTVHSRLLNLGAPCKLIVDMDKILKFDPNKNKYSLRTDYMTNPLSDTKIKEADLFRTHNNTKKTDLNEIRTSITAKLKHSVVMLPGKNYILDPNYIDLIDLIIRYCKYNDVIVNWSTIEGSLITYENIDLFIEFWKNSSLKKNAQFKIIEKETDSKEKTILTLGAFSGKNECFKSPCIANKTAVNPVADKTSGWIESWLDYFFVHKIDCLNTIAEKKDTLKYFFPQLFETLQTIENMV